MNRTNRLSFVFAGLFATMTTVGALTVQVETKAPPVIDPDKYRTIMILNMVDNSEDSRISAGLLAGAQLRQMFRKDSRFVVISDEETDKAKDTVDGFNPRSRRSAIAAAEAANANLVIRGSISFTAFAYSDLGYAPNEGYSVDRGYAPSTSTSTTNQASQIKYSLTLSLTTIDVKTGEIIDRQNIQKSSIKENSSGSTWDLDQRRSELTGLLEAAITDFSNQLHPHKIKRERTLVKI